MDILFVLKKWKNYGCVWIS